MGPKITIEMINEELIKYLDESSKFSKEIFQLILNFNLDNEMILNEHFSYFKELDYLYDYKKNFMSSLKNEVEKKKQQFSSKKDISFDFYDGFQFNP